MDICPVCKRNMNKTIHNWSEVIAGVGLLMLCIPDIYIIYLVSVELAVMATVGTVILVTACIIHLWSEMRVKKYRKQR